MPLSTLDRPRHRQHELPAPAPRRPAGRPPVGHSPAATLLNQAIAVLTLVLLGLRQPLPQGLTTGYAAAILLIPVWLPVLRQYWGARVVMGLGALAALTGIWLTEAASADHTTSRTNMITTTFLLLGTLCGVGAILWARRVLPTYQVGLWFGVGLALAEVTSDGRLSSNPWKFAYAIPGAILLLSFVNRPGRRALEVLALLVLAGVSALQDSRSYFATFLLAAVIVAWQLRPAFSNRRTSTFGAVAFMCVLGAAIYNLGTALIVDGYLGHDVQARSIAQIDTSGSLLLGGRPELAASVALMKDQPWGFGSGTVPNLADILVAKSGMAAVNYNPNNGYVENFMFGGDFKLHSVVAELWAHFGIPGLALGLAIGVVVVRNLGTLVSNRRASAVVTFLACFTLWNLLFSPVYGSVPTVMLALGLGFVVLGAQPQPPRPGRVRAPVTAPARVVRG